MKKIRCKSCGKKIDKINKCTHFKRKCCDCGNKFVGCYSDPLLRCRLSCILGDKLKFAQSLNDIPPTIGQQEAFGCSAEMIQMEWKQIFLVKPYFKEK